MEKSRSLNTESIKLSKRIETLYEEWEAMLMFLEKK
jgi:hypothetical protein